MDWEYHVGMLEYTDQFEQRFQMSWQMFDDLVDELSVPLTGLYVQLMRSSSRNVHIYSEVIVAIGLQIVGLSDTFESCADNYGISVSSSKCVFDLLLIGIDYKETCRAIMTIFPQGEDELRDLAQRWINVSICPQGLF